MPYNKSALTHQDLSELTDDEWPDGATFLRYAPFALCCIGIVFNLLSFSIWMKEKMRRRSGIYLSALALSCLVFSIDTIVYTVAFEWNKKTFLDGQSVCQLFESTFKISQHMSPYLVLAFTVERYIFTRHPANQFCTTKVSLLVVLCIFCFCLIVHVVQGQLLYVNKSLCYVGSEVPSSFNIVYGYFIEATSFAICPIAILVLNVLVIMKTRRLIQAEAEMLNAKEKKTLVTTTTMFVVSFFFIFTILPSSICFYSPHFHPPPEDLFPTTTALLLKNPRWKREVYKEWTCRIFGNVVGLFHYTFNFVIYVLTSSSFRFYLKQIFVRVAATGMGANPSSPPPPPTPPPYNAPTASASRDVSIGRRTRDKHFPATASSDCILPDQATNASMDVTGNLQSSFHSNPDSVDLDGGGSSETSATSATAQLKGEKAGETVFEDLSYISFRADSEANDSAIHRQSESCGSSEGTEGERERYYN